MPNKGKRELELKRGARRTRHALIQAVHAMSSLAAHRDLSTARHEHRTATLALGIGRQLGLNTSELEGLYLGALVHDLGKVAIPSELLSKPTRLTAEQFALVKTHVQAGCDILQNIDFPWPIHAIVSQHHERLDGSGYPKGVTGPGIVLEARIVAVADVFQAMSDDRPYRMARGREAALHELDQGSGVAYDAEAVRALRGLLADQERAGGDLWARLESEEGLSSTATLPALPFDIY